MMNFAKLTLRKIINTRFEHSISLQTLFSLLNYDFPSNFSLKPNTANKNLILKGYNNFQDMSKMQKRFYSSSNNEFHSKINNLPLPNYKETICALASGSGACGVAVIRISGSNAAKICSLILNSAKPSQNSVKFPKPRYATYAKLYHPLTKGLLDTGLVLWFPGPHSFTGEDVVEFQVHGSPAIVKCLLNAIIQTDYARIAQPGEFTRRAFFNNKMDLSEVEGLRDLLTAETDIQRQQALTLSRGVQSRKLNEWKSRISECLSLIDGHIEFGDTDHVSIDISTIDVTLNIIKTEICRAIETSSKGMTIKSGINIALYGVTNAGKSSLLNALTSEDRAIVSDMLNTTRDLIQVRMDLNGYAVNLIDTAGFYNDPSHRVETDAMQKSIEVLFDANTALHVLVIAADMFVNLRKTNEQSGLPLVQSLKDYIEGMYVSGLINEDTLKDELFVKSTIIVVTKIDLIQEDDIKYVNELLKLPYVIATSVVTDIGINKLMDGFIEKVQELYLDFNPEDVQFNTIRALEAIKKAATLIDTAVSTSGPIDIKAQYMRVAIGHLTSVTGGNHSGDMLDDIFENFCVGK